MKQYNDTTDTEKAIIKEHGSWVKSDTDELAYKMTQLDYWRCRAREEGIEHLLIGRR